MEDLFSKDIKSIKQSLSEMNTEFNDTLILNPVENIPIGDILEPCSSFLHGLYNTDTLRNLEEKYKSKIQFSGRNRINKDVNMIYDMWGKLLGAKKVSMRLLSGLHAHTVLFMSVSQIGDKVMVLPEKAGGHVSGKAILERLGLNVKEIPYDVANKHIDKQKCLDIIDTFKPQFLFIDRSEGLIYEDLTWLGNHCSCYKIFDASQYLTNIICREYKNPFDMGFDLILSTMHKNLPGPQRAFICTNRNDEYWHKIKLGISTYVSNMHAFSIYSAGLLLEYFDELKQISKRMLINAALLDQELIIHNVPIIQRYGFNNEKITHHCWIKPPTQEVAFKLFLELEQLGILTNYRLLPYDLGYGLRLGLSGATVSGLKTEDIPYLADIISQAYNQGYSDSLKTQTIEFVRNIKQRMK